MKKASLVQCTICVGLVFSLSACIVSRKRPDTGVDASQQAQMEIERQKQQAQMEIEQQKQQAQAELQQQKDQLTSSAAAAEQKKSMEMANSMVNEIQGDLRFKTGSSAVPSGVRTELKELGTALSSDPNTRITLEGYTDSTGSASVNDKISRERATAVKDVLVQSGVSPDRITVKGMGTSNPVASNSTSSGRAQNRRVEVKLEQAGAEQQAGMTDESATSETITEQPATDQAGQSQDSATTH